MQFQRWLHILIITQLRKVNGNSQQKSFRCLNLSSYLLQGCWWTYDAAHREAILNLLSCHLTGTCRLRIHPPCSLCLALLLWAGWLLTGVARFAQAAQLRACLGRLSTALQAQQTLLQALLLASARHYHFYQSHLLQAVLLLTCPAQYDWHMVAVQNHSVLHWQLDCLRS